MEYTFWWTDSIWITWLCPHLPSSVVLNGLLGYKECKGGDKLWIDSVLVEAVTKSFAATVTGMLPLFWSWGFWPCLFKLQSFSLFHCYGVRSSRGLHMKIDFVANFKLQLQVNIRMCYFLCINFFPIAPPTYHILMCRFSAFQSLSKFTPCFCSNDLLSIAWTMILM